jgi:hypothetical protein
VGILLTVTAFVVEQLAWLRSHPYGVGIHSVRVLYQTAVSGNYEAPELSEVCSNEAINKLEQLDQEKGRVRSFAIESSSSGPTELPLGVIVRVTRDGQRADEEKAIEFTPAYISDIEPWPPPGRATSSTFR